MGKYPLIVIPFVLFSKYRTIFKYSISSNVLEYFKLSHITAELIKTIFKPIISENVLMENLFYFIQNH